jgi:hypothetical protein
MQIFQGPSYSEYLEMHLKRAVDQVRRMPLASLNNPSLHQQFEGLLKPIRAKVPKLLLDQKRGSKREETIQKIDYGRPVSVTQTILDARIPFQGDADLFTFTPSTCSVIAEPVSVEGGALIYSMTLDSNEAQMNKTLERIASNLHQMTVDQDAFHAKALKLLAEVADARKEALEDEKAKGAKFSFPIDNE